MAAAAAAAGGLKASAEEAEWSSDDDYEFEDDVGISSPIGSSPSLHATPPLERALSYTVDHEDTVTTRLQTIVEDLSETLSLGFEDAHLLLVSYRYKAERAMDAYFESPDTTLAAAGLTIKPGSSGPCGSSGDARPDFPNGTSATDTFDPLTCQEIQAWMSTSGKHSEDLQWILANSKPCPRCNRPIEKNEGCKHMTCGKDGSPGCGYDFCWDCMQMWQGHDDFYSCNKPKPQYVKDHEAAASRAKANLPRLKSFSDQYEAHDEAQREALKTHMQASLAVACSLEAASIALPRDAPVLEQAWLAVVRARRALKHSYVWAYIHGEEPDLRGTLAELLFRQEQMEDYVGSLSELLLATSSWRAGRPGGGPPAGGLEWAALMADVQRSKLAAEKYLGVFGSVLDGVEVDARRRQEDAATAAAAQEREQGADAGAASASAELGEDDPVMAKHKAAERLQRLVAELATARAVVRAGSDALRRECGIADV